MFFSIVEAMYFVDPTYILISSFALATIVVEPKYEGKNEKYPF